MQAGQRITLLHKFDEAVGEDVILDGTQTLPSSLAQCLVRLVLDHHGKGDRVGLDEPVRPLVAELHGPSGGGKVGLGSDDLLAQFTGFRGGEGMGAQGRDPTAQALKRLLGCASRLGFCEGLLRTCQTIWILEEPMPHELGLLTQGPRHRRIPDPHHRRPEGVFFGGVHRFVFTVQRVEPRVPRHVRSVLPVRRGLLLGPPPRRRGLLSLR